MADFSPSTGVIIESPGFLPNETGLRNLMLLADMSGKVDKAAARKAMVTLGLGPDEKKPVGKYSLGQRQRLGFAQAFMENPDVLILDEPFNAMDKASMEEFMICFSSSNGMERRSFWQAIVRRISKRLAILFMKWKTEI